MHVEIVETSIFTRRVATLLSDDEYRQLQLALALAPKRGDVIPHSGGLRKLRWGAQGRGKRGGTRVIYYYLDRRQRLYLLLIYAKNEADDLTRDQLARLRALVEEELR